MHPFKYPTQGYLFDGGAAQFPLALAKGLGPAVQVGQPVYKIDHGTPGKVVVHTLKSKYAGKAVILAMPPDLTGRIIYEPQMPPLRDQLTQRVPMGNIIKVLAIYEEPWWRKEGLSGTAAAQVPVIEFVADSTNPRPG